MKAKKVIALILLMHHALVVSAYQPYQWNLMIAAKQLSGDYEMGFKANQDAPGFRIKIITKKDFIGFDYDQTKEPHRTQTFRFDTEHIAFVIELEHRKILVNFITVINYLQNKKMVPSWLEIHCKKVLECYFRNAQSLDGLCYQPLFGKIEEGRHTDTKPLLVFKPK